MKARPSSFFGPKAGRTLTLPTFSVTSKSTSAGRRSSKKQVAYNVESLESVAEESADRQRSLTSS